VPSVYYNQSASFISRGAAEETYRYNSSGLLASYGLGHTVIIGSHSVHRVEALRAVGGLPAHDAEDLYLMRAYQGAGWRGVLVPQILCMGLAPVDWASYLGQQRRWSRAVLDLKLRPPPGASGGPTVRSRILNLFHGTHYLRPLSLLVLYPMLIGLVWTNQVPAFLTLPQLIALGCLSLILLVIGRFDDRFLLDPAHEAGWRWRAMILQFAKAPHMAAALLDVVLGRRIGYVTTSKAGTSGPALALVGPHLAMGVLCLLALGVAVARWGARLAPVLIVTGAGLAAFSLLLVWTAFRRFPPAFESGHFRERRRRLQEVLGTTKAG
jgi:hypothetical protein